MQTSLSNDLFSFKSSEFQAFMLLQASLYWPCLCQQVHELGGPRQVHFITSKQTVFSDSYKFWSYYLIFGY